MIVVGAVILRPGNEQAVVVGELVVETSVEMIRRKAILYRVNVVVGVTRTGIRIGVRP